MNMKLVEDWLATIPSKHTRKTYIAGIKKFEELKEEFEKWEQGKRKMKNINR